MKNKFFISLLFIFSFFLFHSIVNAQAIYPISELGSCRDAKECYLYCQIPQNTPACWSYDTYILQKNVLGENIASDSAIAKTYGITFPITQLGNCENVTQCKTYCEMETNHEACINFAKSHGMTKESIKSTTINKTLKDAQKELGCNTVAECKAYCEQNKNACMNFAKKHLLHSTTTMKKTGPGGCDSESSCKQYCLQHVNECKGFTASNGGSKFSGSQKSGDYLGPGGCKTGTECKQYCTAHPSECPGFQKAYPKPTSSQTYPTYYPKPTTNESTTAQ